MNRNIRFLIRVMLIFAGIICILTFAEYRAADSTIHSIWDAIWYTLITLTTVGYGDKAPVTVLGRMLGIALALCSVGLLSTLVGLVIHLLRKQLMPMLTLRGSRDLKWYVFNSKDRDAKVLADKLAQEEDCLLIFPGNDDASDQDIFDNRVYFDADADRLAGIRKNTDGITMILMKDDPWENYKEGLDAARRGIESYCMADIMEDNMPESLRLFGKEECLGRWYWQKYPLLSSEKCVVIIGCGRSGSAILQSALITNVFASDRITQYHVFEDSAGFEHLHPELVRALRPGTTGEDSLSFHSESWMEAVSLLRRADRIIVTGDRDSENLGVYEKLVTWFGLRDRVFVRLEQTVEGVPSFGESEKILTKEYVMKNALNAEAMLMHEIYSRGAQNPVPFEKLSYFLKQSNISAADHLLVKIRCLLDDEKITEITPQNCRRAYEVYLKTRDEKADLYQEMEHRRWMRFHQLHNWTYNPVRNNEKRQHHLLLPYKELDPSEQIKDAYAWEMLGNLY